MNNLNSQASHLTEHKGGLIYKGKVPYIPLVIGVSFVLLSILAVPFGPLEWHIENPTYLYGFLFLSLLSLVAGYYLATKYKFKFHKAKTIREKNNIDLVMLVCGTIFLLIYFPTCYTLTGKWYPDIVRGISDSGEAYRITKYLNENTSQFVLYLRFLLSPFLVIIPGITVYYYRYLNRVSRIIGILAILLTWLLGISQGISKNTADLAILLSMYSLIVLFADTSTKRQRIKSLFLLLAVFLVFVGLYYVLMKNRVATDVQRSKTAMQVQSQEMPTTKPLSPTNTTPKSSSTTKKPTLPTEKKAPSPSSGIIKKETAVDNATINNETMRYARFGVAELKRDHILFSLVPEAAQSQSVLLLGYITHGYKGLSYALEQPFSSSYGLGFSDFIRHNVLRVLGLSEHEDEIVGRTYMAKLEKNNWPANLYWSTFFVYPASDITFWGTIALMFLIGFLFSLSWKDSVENRNPFSITIFVSLCILILYIPANNQLFLGGESTLGFIGCLFMWLFSHCRLSSYLVNKIGLRIA